MPQWQALSKTAHRDKGLLPRDGYRHAQSDPVVSVLLAELLKLLPHYTLGFVARGKGYMPVALLSLDGESNLYVAANGKWVGSYVPAMMRGYPFALADGSNNQKVVVVDTERLSDEGGEPLFEGDEPSTTVQQTLDFLNQCEKDRQQTAKAAGALQQAGVIVPWALSIPRSEGAEPQRIDGLYRVDEKALNNLDAETYATLRGAPMALAHAHLFSVEQTDQLTKRADYHARQGSTPENLDSLFGEDDDLTFDFG